VLSDAERLELISQVIQRLSQEYDERELLSRDPQTKQAIEERIGVLVAHALRQLHGPRAVELTEESALVQEIARRVLGLGFLDPYLPPARTDLTEITLLPTGALYIKRKGAARFEKVDVHPDTVEVFRVIDQLLGGQGRSLSEATPSVNAKLPKTRDNPGGGRIKAIHPTVAPGLGFPSLNIRLFEQRPVNPEQLLRWGALNEELLDFLAKAVRGYFRILICGGTGTGKTTMLSALCNFIAAEDRIVKIEDPEEIYIDHEHVVTLEARPSPPGSEIPPYRIKDAVDDAMRMTPDWLVVGEVRTGDAALSLFRAQMSDHPGMSTFHADSPQATAHRLSVIMYADAGVRTEAAKSFFAQGVDLLVQIGYDASGIRRVTSITQVEPLLRGGDVQFTHLYRFDKEQSTADRPSWQKVGELTRSR
jgi:pilus assembly protein CpaF